MRKRFKQCLALIFSIALVLTGVSPGVFAAGEIPEAQPAAGSNEAVGSDLITVSFDAGEEASEDAAVPEDILVSEGSPIEEPETVEAPEDYELEGWSAGQPQEEGEEALLWDFDSDVVTSDLAGEDGIVVFYAVWKTAEAAATADMALAAADSSSADAAESDTDTARTSQGSSAGDNAAAGSAKVQKFKVKFKTGKGSAVRTQTVKKGATAKKPKDPTRKGYDFGGWFANKNRTVKWKFTKKIYKDTKIYAKWVSKHSVKFNTRGGSKIKTRIVKAGKAVKKPKDPKRKGYAFAGWYADSKYKTRYNFNRIVKKDLTLYAKWVYVGSVSANITEYKGKKATVKVKWKGNADTYTITVRSKSGTGKIVRTIKNVKKKSRVITSLNAPDKSKKYFITVTADGAENGAKYSTDTAKVQTEARPEAVEDMKAHPGSQSVTLTWKKNGKATGYIVYASKKKDGSYEEVGTVKYKKGVKEYSFRHEDLDRYTTYYYKVYAFGGKSPDDGRISEASTDEAQSVRPMFYSFTMKITTTLPPISRGNPKYTVKKGTRLHAIRFSAGKYVVYDDNAHGYFVKRAWAGNRVADYTRAWDYDRTTAENFVEERGLGSPTGVLIWVSTYTQHAYYFKGSKKNGKWDWKLTHNWEVATGKVSTPTPTGRYGNKAIWKKIRKQHGLNYWSCFSSENGFHGKAGSWPLGAPASSGCVRCSNDNAKFVYDRAPKRTQVFIF